MPLSSIAIPALSRLQADPEKYRLYYCRFVELMLSAGFPLIIFALARVENVIFALLGPNWLSAVPIARALGPAALIGALNVTSGVTFVSLGRTSRQLRANAMSTVAFLAAFAIGAPWGPFGMALATSVAFTVCLPLVVLYALQDWPVSTFDLIHAMWRPCAASVTACFALLVLEGLVGMESRGIHVLLVEAVTFGVLYIGVWATLPRGRQFLKESMGLLSVRSRPGGTWKRHSKVVHLQVAQLPRATSHHTRDKRIGLATRPVTDIWRYVMNGPRVESLTEGSGSGFSSEVLG